MAERLGLLAILGGFFMFLKLFGGVLGGDLSFLVRYFPQIYQYYINISH
jgi:hypothetical protein